MVNSYFGHRNYNSVNQPQRMRITDLTIDRIHSTVCIKIPEPQASQQIV